MSSQATGHLEHRDDTASKIGMWLFIFSELLLFGGLFIVYAIYRGEYSTAFHLAAKELSVPVGTINTVILLISSMTIAMSISAVQLNQRRRAIFLIEITLMLAAVFLINKYFEWHGKFEHGLYPSSKELQGFGNGDVLFYGLYFFMTGLHALHIIIGMILIAVVLRRVIKGKVNSDNYVLLENSGLYWHLVDLIWIFLFPLFYLVA